MKSPNPPQSLYLQFYGDDEAGLDDPIDDNGVTWSRYKIFDADVHYVLSDDKTVRELLKHVDKVSERVMEYNGSHLAKDMRDITIEIGKLEQAIKDHLSPNK